MYIYLFCLLFRYKVKKYILYMQIFFNNLSTNFVYMGIFISFFVLLNTVCTTYFGGTNFY